MITYAMLLLTNPKDIDKVCFIEVQLGTTVCSICSKRMKQFIECVDAGYELFPGRDVLSEALHLVPEELRPVVKYLYKTLS